MAQIRNNESGLMGVTNFRYQSFDAVEKSAPILKEVEEKFFENVSVEVVAYRGVSWEW